MEGSKVPSLYSPTRRRAGATQDNMIGNNSLGVSGDSPLVAATEEKEAPGGQKEITRRRLAEMGPKSAEVSTGTPSTRGENNTMRWRMSQGERIAGRGQPDFRFTRMCYFAGFLLAGPQGGHACASTWLASGCSVAANSHGPMIAAASRNCSRSATCCYRVPRACRGQRFTSTSLGCGQSRRC